jgi:hypothetical protein
VYSDLENMYFTNVFSANACVPLFNKQHFVKQQKLEGALKFKEHVFSKCVP